MIVSRSIEQYACTVYGAYVKIVYVDDMGVTVLCGEYVCVYTCESVWVYTCVWWVYTCVCCSM